MHPGVNESLQAITEVLDRLTHCCVRNSEKIGNMVAFLL